MAMFEPSFPYAESQETPSLSQPLRHSRVRLSQGQIFWREVGAGPDVVYLHGSWQDSSQWLPIIEELASDYHCYTPDRLGSGESESPKIHYSITMAVENLAEYIESLKLDQVYLVGHSLGGWIAASYAIRYQHKVKGLVLISPEGVAVNGIEKQWQWMRWLCGNPPLLATWLKLIHPFTRLFGKGDAIADWLKQRETMMRSPVSCQFLFRRRPAEIQAELLNEQLNSLTIPVLILQGNREQPTTQAMGETLNSMLPNSRLNSLIAGGEDLPEEFPAVVSEYIRQFLPSHPISTRNISISDHS
ncbi:alpha/beta fold hydrolase [Limnospira platensis]|uniref:alpha/beta fold hydrolase n=1 Tax=Limnospira platensis TaxID=118562 RepID=UPI00396C785B